MAGLALIVLVPILFGITAAWVLLRLAVWMAVLIFGLAFGIALVGAALRPPRFV